MINSESVNHPFPHSLTLLKSQPMMERPLTSCDYHGHDPLPTIHAPPLLKIRITTPPISSMGHTPSMKMTTQVGHGRTDRTSPLMLNLTSEPSWAMSLECHSNTYNCLVKMGSPLAWLQPDEMNPSTLISPKPAPI